MTLPGLLLFLFVGLYAVQSLLILLGLRRARYPRCPAYEPTVSIIIAARNEEENIGACLASISRLEYPREKLEIIVVDDCSSDATAEIIARHATDSPVVRTLRTQEEKSHLRGKAAAVAQGIDVAHGEIIMQTDADCVVPPAWVRDTVRYYDERTGVVAGLTLLEDRSWFGGMQSVDWAYILAIASAAMALRTPLSCIGNNFTFRRAAYDEVGGYRRIRFSVTEDFALFEAITGTGHWDYRYPIEGRTVVRSKPCRTFLELYRQKQRWGVGGKEMKVSGFLLMAVSFLLHVSLFLALFGLFAAIPALLALGAKALLDLLVVVRPLRAAGQLGLLKYFPAFELYLMVYVVLLPFVVFLGGDVVWKGRTYPAA